MMMQHVPARAFAGFAVAIVVITLLPSAAPAPTSRPITRPALGAQAQTRPATADSRTIGQLVADLGNKSWAIRESALKRLIEIGEPAIRALHVATRSDDPEVRSRARASLEAIPHSDVAAKVRAMTGARTKIVWVHQVAPKATGLDAKMPKYELKGLDTDEGATRVILPGPACFVNPCLSPDGQKVFYNVPAKGMIHVVNWDGTGKREFTKGYVLCSWRNPADRTQWVYFTAGGHAKGPLVRARIDDASVREVMWDDPSAAPSHTLTVSADGTRAGGEFPLPLAGVAILPNVSWKQYGQGYNAGVAPDNSYRFMHTGKRAGHHAVMMYDDGGLNKRRVNFASSTMPGRKVGDACWAPRWTTDVRFVTTTCPMGGRAAEVYLGQFDDKFTKVVKWVRVTHKPGQDTKAACWIDPGLGRYTGEVPLTVEVPGDAAPGGGWTWDFGDGAKGFAGKHTYSKPGNYTISARKWRRAVKGRVNARPRKAPAVTGTRLLDETRLQVSFDERIRLKGAKVSLSSGTPVKTVAIDGEGLNLIVELAGKLPAADTLRMRGVYDRAQAPNPVPKTVRVGRPAWPGNRNGLVFLWQGPGKTNFQYHPSGKEFASVRLKAFHLARYGFWSAMLLGGDTMTLGRGVFAAIGGGAGIVDRCRRTNEFGIEAVITPDNGYQGHRGDPRRIVSCGGGAAISGVNFALAQEGPRLVLYLHNRVKGAPRPQTRRVDLCGLAAGKPNHVAVGYAPGRLECHLNGKLVKKTDEVAGDLTWRKVSLETGLTMGGATGAFYPWRGKVEHIAVFARALGAGDAANDFAACRKAIATRKKIPRITVRAKLTAKTEVAPRDIAPHPDALLVNEYEVVKVLRGKYAGRKILVAQWGIVDKHVTDPLRTPIGTVCELVLERLDKRPDLLVGWPILDRLREDSKVDVAMPVCYFDVAPQPSGKPRLVDMVLRPGEAWMPVGHKLRFVPETLDQYGNPIRARLKWSVAPGGSLSEGFGTEYRARQGFTEHTRKGAGTVSDGLFTASAPGAVTITATGAGAPDVKCRATVGIGDYPAINPCWTRPMRFGVDNEDGRPFKGDIDRIRIYRRVLAPTEIADHAAGKGLDAKDPDLVGDWTFDKRTGGAYANLASGRTPGLAAKVVDGEVLHIEDKDGKYVRLIGKGHIEVARDKRLDFSKACALEAWIRPRGGGCLIARQMASWRSFYLAVFDAEFFVEGRQSIRWRGFYLGIRPNGMILDGLRTSWGALEGRHKFSPDRWTHVVGILGPAGLWQLYADGRLIKGYKPRPMIVRRSTR